MGGNAAMNAGWRTSLKLFWARNFSRTSCSYPHKYYSADASINQLSKKKLFCFWHHALPDESGFYIHCSVMWNQWSRRIFLKWKKMLWVRVKKARNTSFSASPKAPRFSRRRKRETRVTREWLVTKGKGTEERREAKSRPFSPSHPTSFPGFCPTRPYGAREGQVGENPGNEVASRLPLRANFHQERDWVQGSFFLL